MNPDDKDRLDAFIAELRRAWELIQPAVKRAFRAIVRACRRIHGYFWRAYRQAGYPRGRTIPAMYDWLGESLRNASRMNASMASLERQAKRRCRSALTPCGTMPHEEKAESPP